MRARTWFEAGMITLGPMVALGCDDDVTGPRIASIVFQLEADTLSVNQATQLQMTVLSVDGDTLTDETVTFLSSDEGIITVSDTGVVTAVGPGTATVTARADESTATVTVFVRRAASISIAPGDTTLMVDDTLRLTVTVLDADSMPVADPEVTFTSSNTTVASVFEDGWVMAHFAGGGNTVITAETEGLTAQANITVLPSEVGAVILLPDSLTIAVGDTSRLTVVVQDTAGAVIADPDVVFFCGFGPSGECHAPGAQPNLIATIDSTGLVTGVKAGSSNLLAQSRGVISNPIRLTVN